MPAPIVKTHLRGRSATPITDSPQRCATKAECCLCFFLFDHRGRRRGRVSVLVGLRDRIGGRISAEGARRRDQAVGAAPQEWLSMVYRGEQSHPASKRLRLEVPLSSYELRHV